jgi:hypothetical protein
MNQDELIANMEATAERLTGRAVRVRFKHYDGTLGIIQRDLSGRAWIDLDPILQEPRHVRTFAEIFAHELAHAVKHFDLLPRRDIDQGVTREISKAQAHMKQRTVYKDHENEAESLAAGWMKSIDKYLSYYVGGQDPHLAVLKILYHHPNG